MKKIINFLLFSVFLFITRNTLALHYECTSYDLYNVSNYEMTDGNDTYKCLDYWMQGNTITTKGGDDKVYISKNPVNLIIDLGEGNDTFYHTYNNIQLINTKIYGGSGNDSVIIEGEIKKNFTITGDCFNTCTIVHNEKNWIFNVELNGIENVIIGGENISNTNVDADISNDSNVDIDVNNNSNTNNNTSSGADFNLDNNSSINISNDTISYNTSIITTNYNIEQNKFNNLLFYYGYPTHILDAGKYFNSDKQIQDQTRVNIVIPYFSKFKKIIWAGSLSSKSHEEHDNTIRIIKGIKNYTSSYGYVPMYNGGIYTTQNILNHVDEWISMGVDGIFYDEAGFDYFKQSNPNYFDYKNRLKTIYNYAKFKGLKVIFNSWIASDIFNNLDLDLEDGVLIEDFYYNNGVHKQEYTDNINRYLSFKNSTKAKFYCVGTSEIGSSQETLNKLSSDIKDLMLETCDYRSFQDSYGSSSNLKYTTDDILSGNEITFNDTDSSVNTNIKNNSISNSSVNINTDNNFIINSNTDTSFSSNISSVGINNNSYINTNTDIESNRDKIKDNKYIYSNLEKKIDKFFMKLKKGKKEKVYKNKLILLILKINKLENKLELKENNKDILIVLSFIKEKALFEYYKLIRIIK